MQYKDEHLKFANRIVNFQSDIYTGLKEILECRALELLKANNNLDVARGMLKTLEYIQMLANDYNTKKGNI